MHRQGADARSATVKDSDPDGVRWAMSVVLFCAFFVVLMFLVPFHD